MFDESVRTLLCLASDTPVTDKGVRPMQSLRYLLRAAAVVGCAALLISPRNAVAQSNQIVYDNALENGWQNWSWATTNLSNPSPTHSGADSIQVVAAAYQALYLHHAAFDSSPFVSLSF